MAQQRRLTDKLFMPSKLNSEFNYRYQVIGETPWEKIKTLKGFLEGRIRAAALEKVADLKLQALRAEIDYCIDKGEPPHIVLRLQAELVEIESTLDCQVEAYELNRQEIVTIKSLLEEMYAVAELSRIEGYSDEQMFEANAPVEFAVWVGREIQAEIMATGRPSPAKLRNAMSNPYSFKQLQLLGIIPKESCVLTLSMMEPLDAKGIEIAEQPKLL